MVRRVVLLMSVALGACGSPTRLPVDAGGQDDGKVADAPADAGGGSDAADASDGAVVVDAGSARACPAPSVEDARAECNAVTLEGPWCVAERLTLEDGGVTADGGAVEGPAGGTVIDGDYDLYRWQTTGGSGSTQRTLHISAGGKIEWSLGSKSDATGGATYYKINATFSRSGNSLAFGSATCTTNGSVFDATTYDYTARGDDLILYFRSTPTGPANHIYTYKRRCTR